MTNKTFKKAAVIGLCAMVGAVVGPYFAKPAEAAGLTEASMRLDRMVISQANNQILVIVKPTTTATEASVKIAFATGFTVNATASNITVTTTGIPATYQGETVTAWPSIGTTATGVSGQEVTFASGDLTPGTEYGFYITAGITNPATTGQFLNRITTQDSVPATIDSSQVAVYIVSDNGAATDADQIVITATVGPSYTLDLGSNSQTITTALGSVVSGTGVTATATTNANNGHIMWLKSTNGISTAPLHSATTGTDIALTGQTAANATPDTLAPGTEGFVVDINSTTNTSGSLTVAAEFNGTDTLSGGTPSTSFQEIASAAGPVGAPGDVVTIVPRVAISATTQAADDYTTTLTIVGAGNF